MSVCEDKTMADCVCVCLSLGLSHVAVLDAQHHVGAAAAADALLEEAAAVKRRRHAALCLFSPPLAEGLDVPLPGAGGAVPHLLLRPERGNVEGGVISLFHFQIIQQ